MALFSKKDKENTSIPSNNNVDIITSLSVALGGLLTGNPEQYNSQPGKLANIKSNNIANGNGILGLLSKIEKNTRADNVTKGGVSGVSKSKKSNKDSIPSNIGEFLNAVKSFELKKETKQAFDELAEMTKKGGSIHEIMDNMKEFQAMNIDFDDMSKRMKGFNQSIADMCAIDGNIDSNDIKISSETMSAVTDMVACVIGVAALLVVVGLLSKYIDYKGILKFTLILALFLGSVIGILLYASKEMGENNKLLEVSDDFKELVIVSGAILLVAALISKLIDPKSLFMFTAMLAGFLFTLTFIYNRFENIKEDVSKNVEAFSELVIMSSVIMLLGSYFAKFIDFGDMMKFTLMLAGFMFSLSLTFRIFGKVFKKVKDGADDALIIVTLSAFIMFFGAATVHALDWNDVLLFTIYLGTFLFTIAKIFEKNSELLGDEMPGVKDALLMVTVCAFIMFFGAATMKIVDKESILEFISLFDTFLISIALILGSFHKRFSINQAAYAKTLEAVTKLVAMSTACMLIAGYVIMKNPGIDVAISAYLVLFGIFLTEMAIFYNCITETIGYEKSISGFIVLKSITSFVVQSTLILLIAGWLIAQNPAISAWIAAYLALFAAFLTGMYFFIKKLNELKFNELKHAKTAFRTIEELLLATAVSFLILSEVYKTVEKAGGMGGFTGLIGLFDITIGALIGFVYLLSKAKIGDKESKKIALTLSVVTLALIGTSYAFEKLANVYRIIKRVGSFDEFTDLVLWMGLTLGSITAMTLILAAALGNGVTTAMAFAAIGVVLAVAGAIWIVSDSLLNVADALEKLSKIKSFDATALVDSVKSIIVVADALAPIGYKAPLIAAASSVLTRLVKLISKMSEAVKDYAELKIPIYAGTKKIGYRSLTQNDFDSAAHNISSIVTTLSNGIMQAYEENPQWYGVTFGGNKNSNIFESLLNHDSPLARVINTSVKLAPLISSIARSVKTYADLKIAVKWNDKGEPVEYRHLNKNDFSDAAKNISTIITVLSNGIMQAYEENPQWYGTRFSLFGGNSIEAILNNGTPMERVIAHNIKLARLISSIAKSIKDYANLVVPIKWNDEGKAVDFRNITGTDFKNAAKNIKEILITLGKGIMELWEDSNTRDWFDKDWGGFGSSPFEKVIGTNERLAKLISKVASSVKDYAVLKIATGYDKEGKPTGYRNMSKTDFETAAENISTLLTVLGEGMMTNYEAHSDWYESSWGCFGDNPFETVLEVNKNMSKIISSIASSIKDYAVLKIATKYDKDGKPTKYEMMSEEHFKNAGKNIGLIITTTALGLMGYDPEGNETPAANIIKEYMLDDDEDKYEAFNRVLDSSVKISEVISSLAKGISNFSKMMIPKKWDDKGNPIEYEELKPETFKQASSCITTVITTVAEALMNEVNGPHKDWWMIDEDEDFEKSPLFNILNASEKMGSIIGNIAKGIGEYASMKFPNSFDKNGNPKSWTKLTDADLTGAATKITDVITCTANALMGLYSEHPDWFKIRTVEASVSLGLINLTTEREVGNKTPIETVFEGCLKISNIISGVAQGIRLFASGNMGDNENPIIINDTTLDLAKKSITNVLCNSARAIANLATEETATKLFNNENNEKIFNSLMSISSLLSNTATSIQSIAALNIPDEWDAEGKPTHFIPLLDKDFDKVETHIVKIVSCVSNALNTVIQDAKWLDDVDDSAIGAVVGNWFSSSENKKHSSSAIANAMNSLVKIAMVLSIMSGCIVGYATMRFPMGVDKDGKMQYSDKLNPQDIEDAKGHIVKILLAVGKAINDVVGNQIFTDYLNNTDENKESDIDKIVDYVQNSTTSLTTITTSIKQMIDDDSIKNISTTISELNKFKTKLNNTVNSLGNVLNIVYGKNEKFAVTAGNNKFAELQDQSFARMISAYSSRYNSFKNDSTKILNDLTSFISTLANFGQTENKQNEINKNVESFSSFVNEVLAGFIRIGLIVNKASEISERTGALTDCITNINNSIATAGTKGLNIFKSQTNQIEKFVKTVNTVKLTNLTNLHKFVTSLNQLASRMGNLDKLTDAIANKLSKVLEKLVTRLVHAEQTIVKADKIQERRHELIKKSVSEVSELMKQAMVVEIKNVTATSENPENPENPENT